MNVRDSVRWIVGVAAIGLLGAAAANCGSSGDSTFPGGNGTDAGGDLSEAGGSGFGNGEGGAASGSCKPLTCKDLGDTCGPAGDGCGGKIDCGQCTAPQTCGGGGKPSNCGGTAGCVPKTCMDLGINCGPAGDGCGGTLANCGTCSSPQICGGAGPSKCGGLSLTDGGVPLLPDGGVCMPRTVASCGALECGPVADGCGGLITCMVGGCPVGQTCGGGGAASQCGAPACVKTTCVAAGANCGYVADGCGGILDCGGSQANAGCAAGFCGGGGPNVCGNGGGGGATNFGTKQVVCPAPPGNGPKTGIKGTVFAPNATLPLPGALIYVPNASMVYPFGVTPFVDGITAGKCDTCNAAATGSPLVSTTSSFDGTFELDNIPAGIAFPLVIQLGRWRRVVMIPAVPACTVVSEPAALTRMPVKQHEGNGAAGLGDGSLDSIPRFALSTGRIDALECVFRKLGVVDAEFANPPAVQTNGAAGRIQLYLDDTSGGNPGVAINGATPSTSALVDSPAALDNYDAVIFACTAGPADKTAARRTHVFDYANSGGRVFATHLNYPWLYDVASPAANQFTSAWGGSVNWQVQDALNVLNPADLSQFGANPTSDWALISTAAKSGIFDKWLQVVAAGSLASQWKTAPDRMNIASPRLDAFLPAGAGTEIYMSEYTPVSAAATPAYHFSFNTPYNVANQCGRVIYSDFHVSNYSSTQGTTYPGVCPAATTALTLQEKVLAFMLFDLTSCIATSAPPTCTKIACPAAQKCGPATDGCGGQQSCGTCGPSQVCQGSPAVCVTPSCTKATCKLGQCGLIPDGCNGTVDCGNCAGGLTCGGGGPSMCGSATCTVTTCKAQNIQCGPAADGCGGLLQCGSCPAGQACGGGGTPGVCGAPPCTPTTCAAAGANCGPIADGCGSAIDCGTCSGVQTCGGGGTPNVCGGGGLH